MRTYEELLAAQTELAHFNDKHDPSTGQFAKKGAGSSNSSDASNARRDARYKKNVKTALAVGAAMGAAAYASRKLATTAVNSMFDNVIGPEKGFRVSVNTKKVGERAVAAALTTYGLMSFRDMYADYKRQEAKKKKTDSR